MIARGVILQASYRIHAGAPVLHLYGTLTDNASFLVRVHGERPHFFIRERDAARATTFGAAPILVPGTRNFAGENMVRIEAPTPPDVPRIRDRLHQGRIDTFEADVRFATSYLIDRDVRGSLEIDGGAVRGTQLGWIFDDPV